MFEDGRHNIKSLRELASSLDRTIASEGAALFSMKILDGGSNQSFKRNCTLSWAQRRIAGLGVSGWQWTR